jgi:hypothetical protein
MEQQKQHYMTAIEQVDMKIEQAHQAVLDAQAVLHGLEEKRLRSEKALALLAAVEEGNTPEDEDGLGNF